MSMNIVRCGLMSGFEVTTLDYFSKWGSRLVQWAQRREKRCIQGIFVSTCICPTKKLRCNMSMIQGTNGCESVVWIARILFLILVRAFRAAGETRIAFEQYIEVSRPFTGVEWTLDFCSVRWSRPAGKVLHCHQGFEDGMEIEEWYGLEPL